MERTHKQNQKELRANQQRDAQKKQQQPQEQHHHHHPQQQQQQQFPKCKQENLGHGKMQAAVPGENHQPRTPRNGVGHAGRPSPQQLQQKARQHQQQQHLQQAQAQRQRAQLPNGRPQGQQQQQQRPPLAATVPTIAPSCSLSSPRPSGNGGSGTPVLRRGNLPQQATPPVSLEYSGSGGDASPRAIPLPPVPSKFSDGGSRFAGPVEAPTPAAVAAERVALHESSPNKAFRSGGGGDVMLEGAAQKSNSPTFAYAAAVEGGDGGGGVPLVAASASAACGTASAQCGPTGLGLPPEGRSTAGVTVGRSAEYGGDDGGGGVGGGGGDEFDLSQVSFV